VLTLFKASGDWQSNAKRRHAETRVEQDDSHTKASKRENDRGGRRRSVRSADKAKQATQHPVQPATTANSTCHVLRIPQPAVKDLDTHYRHFKISLTCTNCAKQPHELIMRTCRSKHVFCGPIPWRFKHRASEKKIYVFWVRRVMSLTLFRCNMIFNMFFALSDAKKYPISE
jgi:hypothetical protein